MKAESIQSIDVLQLARAGANLAGDLPVQRFERLHAEQLDVSAQAGTGTSVNFRFELHQKIQAGGAAISFASLTACVVLQTTCQRCLTGMAQKLEVSNRYRFVASEDQAEHDDEASEEDLLVYSKQFNLLELIEDELLMALPYAPAHDVCPHGSTGRLETEFLQPEHDEAEKPQKPNPFAALTGLKSKP
jgi:uncharacterized protein